MGINKPGRADDYQSDAIKQESVFQPARQEARAHEQPFERQQPQTPERLVDAVGMRVNPDSQ